MLGLAGQPAAAWPSGAAASSSTSRARDWSCVSGRLVGSEAVQRRRLQFSTGVPEAERPRTLTLLGAGATAAAVAHLRRPPAARRRRGARAAAEAAAPDVAEAERLLRAGLYDAALARGGGGTPRGAAVRAAALAGLRRYEDSLEALGSVDAIAAGIDAAEFRAAVERLRRQSEGNFQFMEVYGDALSATETGMDPAAPSSPTAALLPRFADYTGPVEVVATANGRGVVATRDIKGGEVIFCAYPLVLAPRASSPSEEEPSQAQLRYACEKSPHARHVVSDLLSDGSQGPASISFEDFKWPRSDDMDAGVNEGADVTDARIAGVAKTNMFGSFGYEMLYPAISMTNHSCCPNAVKVLVGFSLFIRAIRGIRAGEEVCTSYFDVLRPVAEREKLTKNWDFHCGCPRCTYERTLPSELQSKGPSAKEVETAIKDPANDIDILSREVQWLRAGHVEAYKAELEELFPLGEEADFQRDRLLRAMETTDPASFSHAKIAYLDWLCKQSKPGPREPPTMQAMRYCGLVHETRYGPVPGDQMVRLLKRTQASAQSTGVGEEFCNPKACPPGGGNVAAPSSTATAPPPGGASLAMLD